MNTWYCDGSTYKNGQPGQDSSYLILCPDGDIIRKHIGDFSINQAELFAIEEAIELAGMGDIIVTDSRTAYLWILNFKPNKNNKHVADRVKSLVPYAQAKDLSIKWLPREDNLAGKIIEEDPFYE